MSSSASLAAEARRPPEPTGPVRSRGRSLHAAKLAFRAIRRGGRGYGELAAHLSDDTVRFIEGRAALPGARVLDLGSGFGEFGRTLAAAGARVVSLDRRPLGAPSQVVADARLALPFRSGSFDGVVCSNILEHVPSPPDLVAEIARVVRAGGWVYLSWTAWYGPLGGHEYSPWHYFGVRAARAIGSRIRWGAGHNVPGEQLFPVHVGSTMRGIRATGAFRVVFAGPRYWPSQRWIVKVPGLREVATWNCLLFLERR